jgi:hypothetical protein
VIVDDVADDRGDVQKPTIAGLEPKKSGEQQSRRRTAGAGSVPELEFDGDAIE